MLTSGPLPVLLTRIGETQLALPANEIQEIVRAVALTQIAGAPAIIEGALNLRGTVVPVVDVRDRLGLPECQLAPSQYLVVVIVSSAKGAPGSRLIAIRVDDVSDVSEIDVNLLCPPESISPALRRIQGIVPTDDGAVVLYDTGSFLSQAEHDAVDTALAKAAVPVPA